MGDDVVRLAGVEKRYGAVTALARVDLEVRKGEFLTLLGPSGSGKTTILNVIAGTIQPSAGRIFIAGRDMTDVPSNQRRLGMVFQNYALMPHMTIFENIAFPLRVRKRPEAEIRDKVGHVLELVQLPSVAQRKPKELSGGQQQRIAIARCLVYDPEIILMDEPLGALDKKLRDQMQLEIKRLHDKLGVTILYVTHDQEEALVMSDRICLMNQGRIEQLGTPNDLYFSPVSTFAADFLGESNILKLTVATGETAGDSSVERRAMVRPEDVQILSADDSAAISVVGVVEDVIFVGSVTKLRIRSADGEVITAKQLTRASHAQVGIGQEVRIGWSSEAVRALGS